MSNSTAKTRSSAPARSSSSSSAPKRTSAPTRNTQASSARSRTLPSGPRPHDAHLRNEAPVRTTTPPESGTKTTPTTTRDQSEALNRLEKGKTNTPETKLQTGQDGMVPFEDKTKGGAAVADHADRVASGFADAFGPPQQDAGSGSCPDGKCGQQASGGGEAGGAEGGGGGGGFLDKLTQLAQVGGDIAIKAIEAAKSGAQQGAEAAQQGIEAAGEAAGQGIDKAKELLKQATTRFDLNDEQKQLLQDALGTFRNLAGEDGRWNEQDLANNYAQLNAGVFAGPAVRMGMKKGITEATGKEAKDPTPEEVAAARERFRNLSPEERAKQQIGVGDMKDFRDAMNMVKARAKELGLPENKFPQGMSVDFLQSILNNDPGWRMKLNQ